MEKSLKRKSYIKYILILLYCITMCCWIVNGVLEQYDINKGINFVIVLLVGMFLGGLLFWLIMKISRKKSSAYFRFLKCLEEGGMTPELVNQVVEELNKMNGEAPGNEANFVMHCIMLSHYFFVIGDFNNALKFNGRINPRIISNVDDLQVRQLMMIEYFGRYLEIYYYLDDKENFDKVMQDAKPVLEQNKNKYDDIDVIIFSEELYNASMHERYEEAFELGEKVRMLLEKIPGKNMTVYYIDMFCVYKKMGDNTKAEEYLKKAEDISSTYVEKLSIDLCKKFPLKRQ